MNSRDKILAAVSKNQPPGIPLPVMPPLIPDTHDLVQKFIRTLGNIGGTGIQASSWSEVKAHLSERFPFVKRRINLIPELGDVTSNSDFNNAPHLLEDVSLAIFRGHFGVAENGAVWITDERFGDRALPFICEHIVLVIYGEDIVPTLREAYAHIGTSGHDFGAFIAGPSKTADIEQSLVLGAHGPKSMTLFVVPKGI